MNARIAGAGRALGGGRGTRRRAPTLRADGSIAVDSSTAAEFDERAAVPDHGLPEPPIPATTC